MYGNKVLKVSGLLAVLWLSACSSVGIGSSSDNPKLISNPFADYDFHTSDRSQNMILRTKKGDRAVELEIPGDQEHLSDFVLPMSPSFREANRGIASENTPNSSLDETYKGRESSFSDREITHQFPKGSVTDDAKRSDIEKGLNLRLTDDDLYGAEKTPSYLAGMDRIKQLYRLSRYEVALIETDGMIRLYPTDSKLHAMRGTLLDRLGRRELALESWNQALRLQPDNATLKRFIERKKVTRILSGGSGTP